MKKPLSSRVRTAVDKAVREWLDSIGLVKRPQRTVRCIHCAEPFVVPGMAEVLTCPSCSRRVRVDDVVVETTLDDGRVETCGSVIVREGARFRTISIKAGMGLLVEGEVTTGSAAAPIVVIARGAVWKGDLQTAKLDLHPDAQIRGGRFKVRADRLSA